jgi:hypothetical protein
MMAELAPEAEIDAGAKALRNRQQGDIRGQDLKAWELLPNAAKRKWRDYAACVLNAAATVRETKP